MMSDNRPHGATQTFIDGPVEPVASADGPDLVVFDAGDDDDEIEPRQWLLGSLFCRTFTSALVGEGGAGKSAVRLGQLLSLATGRSLTGDHVHKRCRVLIVSLEDDRDELRRRIKAAKLHHGISQAELKGWLFYCTPTGVKLADLVEGSPAVGRLDGAVRRVIQHRKIDIVYFDPLVKAHGLSENDNGAMDYVAGLLANIARDMNCAADYAHHTRKGIAEAGSADAGRGAGAIKDAARLVYTVVKMTPQEAQLFGIGERERLLYIRMDSAKVNLCPPSAEARWFKLVGVELGNGTAGYPAGDTVQTVEPWQPPDAWAGVSIFLANEILNSLDKGLPDGRRYSSAPRAGDIAAWKIVQQFAPGKTEGEARQIIKGWLAAGVLVNEDYHDPVRRAPAQGLRVINAKRPA